MKKVLSMLLVLTVIFASLAFTSVIANAANTADSIVEIAQGELGSSNYKKYYNGNYNQWCADFVSWCAQQAGVDSIYASSSCYTMYNVMKNQYHCQQVSSPQKGDIVFFVCSKCDSTGGHWCHVGIMEDSVYSIEGNNWTDGTSRVQRAKSYNHKGDLGYSHGDSTGSITRLYLRPNYNNKPSPINMGDNFYAMLANKDNTKAIGLDEENRIIVCPYNGYNDQLWHFIRQSDGGYKIINVYTDTYLIGDNIASLEYEAGNNNKVWYIMNGNSGYCLTHYSGDQLKWLHPAYESWVNGNQITLNNAESEMNVNLVSGIDNKPMDFDIKNKEQSIAESSNLKIEWTKSKFANFYNLDVWKDDGAHLVSTKTRNTYYTLQNLFPGYYGIYINAENEIGQSDYKVLHFTVIANNAVILGDANGDGEVELTDAAFIQRYCTDIDTDIDEAILMHGDVDGSGELELTDATFIQRYATDLYVPFSIGKAITY